MDEFMQKRIDICKELGLPESCIYCKGLGFNCQETIWKNYMYDNNLNKTDTIETSVFPACKQYLEYNVNPVVRFVDTTGKPVK